MTDLEKEVEDYLIKRLSIDIDEFEKAKEDASFANDLKLKIDCCKAIVKSSDDRLAKLEKENKKLNRQLSDIVECFQSASSGDDFEMAEAAREIMEILDISCYRHGKVKSKLTEAKEIIKDFLLWENNWHEKTESKYALLERAEDFIKE